MEKEKTSKYAAPALEKGLEILEHLSATGISQSQNEIALGLDRKPNELYRMLMTLEEKGYIIRNEKDGKYRLSLKMYNLSHMHSPFDELKRVSLRPMQELSESVREACHLGIMVNGALMIIAQSPSPEAVSISIKEGIHFPLLQTASGKMLLSQKNESERAAILQNHPDFNAMEKQEQAAFLESVKLIEKEGFFISASKLTRGVTDLTVPIGHPEAEPVAALTISSFSEHGSDEERHLNIIQQMLEARKKIHHSMGL
ncbi:IclR family transcriptional regulator [Persicobacter diffluens]|uniref:Transcriptional regulator n=1 Tax=Persicobacter diffluens TaxID=981 RepID=A0AAN4W2Q7_9BACT|nr:transcriptional regulator [Persicobacter diffluens]